MFRYREDMFRYRGEMFSNEERKSSLAIKVDFFSETEYFSVTESPVTNNLFIFLLIYISQLRHFVFVSWIGICLSKVV